MYIDRKQNSRNRDLIPSCPLIGFSVRAITPSNYWYGLQLKCSISTYVEVLTERANIMHSQTKCKENHTTIVHTQVAFHKLVEIEPWILIRHIWYVTSSHSSQRVCEWCILHVRLTYDQGWPSRNRTLIQCSKHTRTRQRPDALQPKSCSLVEGKR